MDDAHASPEGRGPKARVNPSLSANKNPCKSRILRRNGISGKKPAVFYCHPTASYVGILVHSYDASAVAARLLNRVLPSVKERELRLSLGQMNATSSEITVSNGGVCAERSRTKADHCCILLSSRKNSGEKASGGASGIAVCRLANVAAIACARRSRLKS